jgi:hypothetical protein
VVEGEKGPRIYDWGPERVIESRDHLPGPEVWLLVRRSVSDSTELAYYPAWAPLDTTVPTLARIAATRYTVEQCIEEAKGEVDFCGGPLCQDNLTGDYKVDRPPFKSSLSLLADTLFQRHA